MSHLPRLFCYLEGSSLDTMEKMVLKLWVQQVLVQLCAFLVRYVWDPQTEHLSIFWVVLLGWCCLTDSPYRSSESSVHSVPT